jgi:hypothetical protein
MSFSKLSIPEPCPENWDNMQQIHKGKFCDLCSKEVTDFTNWTDLEIIKHFENLQTSTTSKTCGRLSTRQVERINLILQSNESQQPNLWRIFAWAFSATALSSAIALQDANATEKPVNQEIIRNVAGENMVLESEEKQRNITTNINVEIIEMLQGDIYIQTKLKKKRKLTLWQRIKKIKLF